MKLEPGKNAENVYVILAVSNVGKATCKISVYVDPATMILEGKMSEDGGHHRIGMLEQSDRDPGV